MGSTSRILQPIYYDDQNSLCSYQDDKEALSPSDPDASNYDFVGDADTWCTEFNGVIHNFLGK